MPAAQGKVSEELDEFIDKLVEEGRFDSRSEAVGELTRFGAALKFGYEGR